MSKVKDNKGSNPKPSTKGGTKSTNTSFWKKDAKGKPMDLVKNAKEALTILGKDKNQKAIEKAREETTKNLQGLKELLLGNTETTTTPETITQVASEIFNHDLIPCFVSNLEKIEFEAKKDVASIFNFLLRRSTGKDSRNLTVEYILKNPQIIDMLVKGCDNPDIALNCGAMLRECIRHEELAKMMLYSENFYKFFLIIEMPNFDVASDGFATFKDLLTKHKQICAEFLEKNYDKIFDNYTKLLHSDNYVTKRQSLKLLGELLLDRANFNVMTRYISQQANLKLMMNLLRDRSRSIQFEAFHVFKVFVANPNKPAPILNILIKNKAKLIKFLANFHNDKDDEQFTEEKAFLIKQIEQL
eukprot:TRINITY_DN2128_c0_g1_i2.p1 TRINITY_DN2128_c0_g1~~TRINITY_DN2128_c0_g1_i2.p1  ORF type:complete len:371 (+),score=61.06 TRINITY_DN2128_c0_g1_i2:40-1113(+)